MIVTRKPDRNVIFSARMTYGTCDHHEDKNDRRSGEDHMTSSGVNAGGRLDRLPIARFHYRIFP
ncbi:hypothetical protein [Bradyrhizobium sp. S69]|uniref:hypothetical protein n=1 Tax=Bradyrhizobium sp. S69 TaxID=1641856 RepID=UPI001AEDA2B8|nr:hypothetical protein [Bradyrhizobium sp. S69]